ncbi:hypothetical protein BJV78DRAFT_585302 [Lactifluus subvellereus]|nr:hypothetical protein BJV78DRAFT_585302 [Lactifluus subvellereus]
MSDADCPICMNHFKFEDIRSLPCGKSQSRTPIDDVQPVPSSSVGHTYCWSCIDELIERPYAEDDISRCPECRQGFEVDDVRRLFINPCARNNNSAPQATPSGVNSSVEEQGFVKQATYIAKRLRKMDAESPVQSVKRAVDIIEHVATIQCKEAQEIVWKAVREFWLSLVPYLGQLDRIKKLEIDTIDLRHSLNISVHTTAELRSEVETWRDLAQQCTHKLEDKDQEIAELKMALREVDDERDRHHVVLARLRASETKHRAQIKQLKKELKFREDGTATSVLRLEDESLIIEPDVSYDETRSHRLSIYNGSSPRSNHREVSQAIITVRLPPLLNSLLTQSLPEASVYADGLGDTFSGDDLPDDWPSKRPTFPPDPQAQLRKQTGQPHTVDPPEQEPEPEPERPKFGSDWNLRRLRPRQAQARSTSEKLPFPLDARGRPKSLLKYGSRVRVKGK